MYDVASYGKMIADEVRTSAHFAALRQCITKDSVVLDIGTGTGIFALLACELGAKKVFAIESSEVIELARETAKANGFADRIEFIHDMSTRVSLPQRADVMISDMRGVLPLHANHLTSIIDARKRLLKTNGVMIPQSDSLWAAVVDGTTLYERYQEPWVSKPFGLDLQAGRRYVVNSWRKGSVGAQELMSRAHCWANLDYRTIEETQIRSVINLPITKDGCSHGLLIWFNSILHDDISITNDPQAIELIYGRGFFPWKEPVEVNVGDCVVVDLRADLVSDDYVWTWATSIFSGGSTKKLKTAFSQSTFAGKVLSRSKLRKVAANFIPTLSEDGQITKFILSRFDGSNSIETVARQLLAQFPNRFDRWEDAFDEVSRVSSRFS